MYQRAEVHGSRLCSGLIGVCLLLVFAIHNAKAVPLLPPVPPVTPARVDGFLLANLLPHALEINDFGEYLLVQPSGGTSGDSGLTFRALPTPAPLLEGRIGMAPFHYGRAQAALTYDLQILGPDGSVPIQVDVSGAVLTHPGLGDWSPQPTYPVFIVQALWGIEGVFNEGIDAGPLSFDQNGFDFEDSFSHTVSLNLTANRTFKVTMLARAEASGGEFGAFARAFIDPVFSFAPGVDPAYSFRFSPGIGNSSVPEPGSTVVLLSIGATALAILRSSGPTRKGSVLSIDKCFNRLPLSF